MLRVVLASIFASSAISTLVTLAVVQMMHPTSVEAQGVQRQVIAREFLLVDDAGNVRGELRSAGTDTALTLWSGGPNSTTGNTFLYASENIRGLSVTNWAGHSMVASVTSDGAATMRFVEFDQEDRVRSMPLRLDVSPDGAASARIGATQIP